MSSSATATVASASAPEARPEPLQVGTRPRILTGDRPTGPLHVGHYVGSVKNRIELQDRYECFFIIADVHTLTTRPEKPFVGELAEQHPRGRESTTSPPGSIPNAPSCSSRARCRRPTS